MGQTSISFITNFLIRIRNRHLFFVDVFVLLITPFVALFLRLGSTEVISSLVPSLVLLTIAFLGIKLFFLYLLNLYKRYWRYASVDELARIALAMTASLAVGFGLFLGLQRLGFVSPVFPASILLTEVLFAFILIGGSRFSIRFAYKIRHHTGSIGDRIPVLIVGAGEAGALIASEMQANADLGMWPAVFVDDDAEKHGLQIRGVTIEAGSDKIRDLARKYGLTHAVIALPSATGKSIRRVLDICMEARLETTTIPGLAELLGGTVHVSQLRPVIIEDLLRREPVIVQAETLLETIRGKRILVTGGGGSIGSELCRQILKYYPASLVVLDHSENAVFDVLKELEEQKSQLGSSCDVVGLLGDIRHKRRLEGAFETSLPEIVFHAAAHKHVPLLEVHACEAVLNNVQGTLNVVDACRRFDVRRMVMLSSDKAVRPTSVMGATKRVAERLVEQIALDHNLRYVSVRFGNVLGSRGSVVPEFQRQIRSGGPVTVTHEDVRRFFMSIPEAAQLVLQAGAMAERGEVYVLDMGEPIRIVELAEDLIRLSGLEPHVDIEIEFTGLRPGEKLYEELRYPSEHLHATKHEKVLVAVRKKKETADVLLSSLVKELISKAKQNDESGSVARLKKIVPEFGFAAPIPPQHKDGSVDSVPDLAGVKNG